MAKSILITFLCLLYSVASVAAQGEKGNASAKNAMDEQRAEMKKLESWIGKWQGAGWIEQAKGRENFAGTETVQRKLDGLALLVEGKFKNKQDVVIHETLAVLSPNQKSKNYDFNTFLASGIKGLQELKAIESGWQWGFEFPAGAVRYTIKINDKTWLETGEMTMDGGKNWRKFFEMNLSKVE